jgi:hypothetical protein
MFSRKNSRHLQSRRLQVPLDCSDVIHGVKERMPLVTFIPTVVTRCHITSEDSILPCYRRDNEQSYIVVPYVRQIKTYDEATAHQLYLHGNGLTR